MTKSDLQKELKEKVKEGVKPSDLKKLKRSKSADDIPIAPLLPLSTPLNRSKSQEPFADPKYPYTTLISQQEELEALKKESKAKSDTIALLRKKITELEQTTPPNQLLQDQLNNKQKEIEELRAKLETAHSQLNTLQTEHSNLLDTNLTLKHQALKDWWTQYQQTQQLESELKENVEYDSNELLAQDQTISTLRDKLRKLKQTQQSLEKDLELTSKLAQLRKNPLPSPDDYPFLKYALYSLAVSVFTLWLVNSFKNIPNKP